MSAAVTQRPGRLDLELVQGDDASLELSFVDADAVAVDLSGRAWSLRIAGPGLYVELDSAVDTTDEATGVLVVPFAAATTAAIGRDVTWSLRDTTNKRTLLDGELRAYVAGHAGAGSSSIEQTVTITNATAAVTVTAAVVGGGGVALGETSTTAYRGDRGKTAYDHSQVVSGNPHGTTAADVGADPAGTAAGLVDDLSGVSNQATARTNLGLGSAAVEAASAFATAAQGVDARTPTAHKTSHENGGADELALDASQITSGTVDQARLGTGSAGAGAKFLADDQTYKTVSSGIADPGGANDDFLQRKSGAWTYRTVAQVKTDLGVVAGAVEGSGTAVAKNYGALGWRFIATPTTWPNTAGITYYQAVEMHGDWTISALEIAVQAQSATAAGRAVIGVYTANALWQPQTRVGYTGELDVSSTGTKTGSVSLSGSAGRYVFSMNCNENFTPRARQGTGPMCGMNGTISSASDGFHAMHRVTQTYASPPPSTPTAWDTVSTNALALMFIFAVVGEP